jgi:hypothetical protein
MSTDQGEQLRRGASWRRAPRRSSIAASGMRGFRRLRMVRRLTQGSHEELTRV